MSTMTLAARQRPQPSTMSRPGRLRGSRTADRARRPPPDADPVAFGGLCLCGNESLWCLGCAQLLRCGVSLAQQPTRTRARHDTVRTLTKRAPNRSVGHQHRQIGCVQDAPGEAAEHHFPHAAMTVAAHHQQISAELGSKP